MGRGSDPERIVAAEADLASRRSPADVLKALAGHLVETLDASACVVSRIVGDMLVQLTEHTRAGTTLKQLGHGYLIADFPLTREVLEKSETRTVTLDDPDADDAEARLLRELGFDALLMTPLCVDARPWALVEVYGAGRGRFDGSNETVARSLSDAAGSVLERLA